MAISETVNSLSLDRYAWIIGINPVHFAGSGNIANDDGDYIFPLRDTDSQFYQTRAYNANNAISREEIAREIETAELEIEDYLSTHVAPKWREEEELELKMHYDPLVGYNFRNVRQQRVMFHPRFGKFVSGGARASSLIEAGVTVTVSDEDGDGFSETATIEVDISDSSISLYEVKAYFPGESGNPQYEIRAPKSKTISGTTVTFVYNVWQIIKPSIWERFPTEENERVIDIKDSDNLVDTVDIYREYNDTTEDHVKFVYQPSSNSSELCSATSYTRLYK